MIATLEEERIDSPTIRIQNESRAQTDDQGHFVIERVVPGDARVHWQPSFGGERTMPDRYYQAPFRIVAPGQTVHVDVIQEGGRPLAGKINTSDGAAGALDLSKVTAYLQMKPPEIPYPLGLPEDGRREWLSRWRLSEKGRAYQHARRGFGHTINLKPDGTFRVDEIQPGAYQIHVRSNGYRELIRGFEVSAAADGESAVVDLGTIGLKR